MKLPRADPSTVARFHALVPNDAGVTVRPVFGQPAAFVAGNMFLGVFGDAVFVRLSEEDRAAGRLPDGARPFEPMPGHPMREYVVLPPTLTAEPARARPWIESGLRYARGLGPKPPKRPARAKAR